MDHSWIATAFTAVNAVRVVFYVPQILAVARSVDGARDIALSTWSMWALTNALGTAYGALVVHDLMLAASFALSLAACVLTVGLALVKRVRFVRRQAAPPGVLAVRLSDRSPENHHHVRVHSRSQLAARRARLSEQPLQPQAPDPL